MLIAEQTWKFPIQVLAHLEKFELSIPNLVEQHHQRHQLGQRQAGRAISAPLAVSDQLGFQSRFKFFAEIVHQAVQLGKMIHERPVVSRSVSNPSTPPVTFWPELNYCI